MEKITLEYLENHFDQVLGEAETGKSFLILTPDGKDIALVPNEESIKTSIDNGLITSIEEEEEWIRMMNTNDS